MFCFRHQLFHKLIFEEDGLPDGAEVAYYARGQVVSVCISYRSYYVYHSVNWYIPIGRNCSRVSKSNPELFVDAATLRYLYFLFNYMFVGTYKEFVSSTVIRNMIKKRKFLLDEWTNDRPQAKLRPNTFNAGQTQAL